MAGLSRELLAHKASFVLPVDTLCMELQTIADAYSEAGGSVRHALIAFVLFVLFFLLRTKKCAGLFSPCTAYAVGLNSFLGLFGRGKNKKQMLGCSLGPMRR